jgi:hypothetical protein
MPAGRPTIFNKKLAKKICELRAKGNSLRKICKPEDMPNRYTVRLWLLDSKKIGFFDQYARACEVDADNIFDELIELADKCKDPAHAQVLRLRIDTRKWVLSKRLPKKYGDKLRKEVSGPDGGPIPTVNANLEITADMDPCEAMKRYAQLVKGEG